MYAISSFLRSLADIFSFLQIYEKFPVAEDQVVREVSWFEFLNSRGA
jgi:hypothetical protein